MNLELTQSEVLVVGNMVLCTFRVDLIWKACILFLHKYNVFIFGNENSFFESEKSFIKQSFYVMWALDHKTTLRFLAYAFLAFLDDTSEFVRANTSKLYIPNLFFTQIRPLLFI